MTTDCNTNLFGFTEVEGREVVAGFDGGAITSDAGALLLGAADRAIGLIDRFAGHFHDERCPELIEHEVATLVGQRVFGIALGYEDLNDHDDLRHDPIMAVLAGKLTARREECAPVAGKSTLNRLELSVITRSVIIRWRLEVCSSIFFWKLTNDHRVRLSSILMPPMIRSMGSRRGGSITAITTVIATCRCTCSAEGTCWPPSCA